MVRLRKGAKKTGVREERLHVQHIAFSFSHHQVKISARPFLVGCLPHGMFLEWYREGDISYVRPPRVVDVTAVI